MTSTIRIHVSQAKAGMVRVQRFDRVRIIEVNTDGLGWTHITYDWRGQEISSSHHTSFAPSAQSIEIVLEETHPISVLERMLDRVEEQLSAARAEFLEACRDPQDEGHVARRREDKALLQGKFWGLAQAITELRAGMEFNPATA